MYQHINFCCKGIFKKAKDINKELKKRFDEAATHFEQFIIDFPHQTREYLMGHAKAVLQPDQDYYNNLFHKEGGDLYEMIIMASAIKQ